ncbi:MAG TPA: alpha/beta hydrolase, partial [Kiritimatiellia bacterium]
VRPFLDELQWMGFSVFAFDYSGYGTSEGKPTESGVYEDTLAAFDYMTNALRIAPGNIIAHGRSVGAAMAIDLATKRPVGGLVVESGFVTAFRVKTVIPIAPFDRFRNIDKIARVKCPVLVFHGRNDDVVPFWHGEKLFEAAPEPKRSAWIDEAGHNDLFWIAGGRYRTELESLASLVGSKLD